jgi:hypothetical protein
MEGALDGRGRYTNILGTDGGLAPWPASLFPSPFHVFYLQSELKQRWVPEGLLLGKMGEGRAQQGPQPPASI